MVKKYKSERLGTLLPNHLRKEHSKIIYAFLLGLLPPLFVSGSVVEPLIPLLRTLAPTGRNLRLAKVDFPSLIWNKIPTKKRHVIFFVFLGGQKKPSNKIGSNF